MPNNSLERMPAKSGAPLSSQSLGGGMVIAKLLEALGLRRLPPPADPVFRFKKFYSFETPYWEAEAEFEPVGRVVEVLVECPRSGASPGQHEFFAELARRYSEVLSAVHRMLAPPHCYLQVGRG